MDNNNLGENLIFLISQPRSGSTLLQRILSSHQEIHTTGETWLLLHPIYAIKKHGHSAEYNSEWANFALTTFLNSIPNGEECYYEAIRNMALTLYNKSLESSNKFYFLDKTPRYYLIIPELAKIFPNAKFIILLRNPLSVLSSILNTWIKSNWLKLRNYYIDLFEAPELLHNGIELLHGKSHVIKYEDIITAPRVEVERLLNFLKLNYDPSIIDYGLSKDPNWLFGDQTGIKKYKRPEKANVDNWKQLLQTSQGIYLGKRYLDILGEDLMLKLGYNYIEYVNAFNNTYKFTLDITISTDKIFFSELDTWNKSYLRTIGFIDRLQNIFCKI